VSGKQLLVLNHGGADQRRRGCCVNARLKAQTDRDLLDKVMAGDGEALRELYLIYHRQLANFLLRFTQRRDLVEEVINDTLYVVWCKAGEFRGDSRLSTWIMGIVGLRPGPFLRGDCRDHGLPCEYRKDANVSRTPQTAHALAAARRNGLRLAISLKRLNRTHRWLHSSVIALFA